MSALGDLITFTTNSESSPAVSNSEQMYKFPVAIWRILSDSSEIISLTYI